MIFFTGPCSSCKGVFQHQILARCHGADQKTSRWKAVIPSVHSEVTEGIAKDPSISDDRDYHGKNERDCHDEVTYSNVLDEDHYDLVQFQGLVFKRSDERMSIVVSPTREARSTKMNRPAQVYLVPSLFIPNKVYNCSYRLPLCVYRKIVTTITNEVIDILLFDNLLYVRFSLQAS